MVALCIFICFLLISPSAVSLHIHIALLNPHHQGRKLINIATVDPDANNAAQVDDHLLQLHRVLLPRKLKLAEIATESGKGVGINYNGKTSSFPGGMYKKGEKWGEEEEDRMSDFMGMDYARVRRRRHIHNKFLHP